MMKYIFTFLAGFACCYFFSPTLNLEQKGPLAAADGQTVIAGLVTKNMAFGDHYVIEFEVQPGQRVYVLPRQRHVVGEQTNMVLEAAPVLEYGPSGVYYYREVGG